MTDVVVALDVGGTKAHGALVDRSYGLLFERVVPTMGRDPGLVSTRGLADELFGVASSRGYKVHGYVAGFPEYVSNDGRVTAHDVLDWTEQPAIALTVDRSVPVRIRSDVKCGARGELALGHGRFCDSFAYISLGTGLSSALVVDGHIHEGARGEAIGFGEWAVSARIDPDWTGNLEQYGSGTGIMERYVALTGRDVVMDGARGVLDAARQGDMVAMKVVESAGQAIGRALAQLVSVLDPPLLVLAGGLGTADTRVGDALRSEYECASAHRPDPPALLTSAVPTGPGLLGAAVYAWTSDDPMKAPASE